MIHLLAALASTNDSLLVTAGVAAISNNRIGADCFAGVRFNNDGTEQAADATGAWVVSRGNWLDRGGSSQVWVKRTINSGTLDWLDPGAGRLQLSTTRSFGNTRTVVGADTTNVTFDFYDAAAGGNLLDSATYDIIAEEDQA